jgi:hypothetical protein
LIKGVGSILVRLPTGESLAIFFHTVLSTCKKIVLLIQASFNTSFPVVIRMRVTYEKGRKAEANKDRKEE